MGKLCSQEAPVCGSDGSNTIKVGNACICADMECPPGTTQSSDKKKCELNTATTQTISVCNGALCQQLTLENLQGKLQVQLVSDKTDKKEFTGTVPNLQMVSLDAPQADLQGMLVVPGQH